MHDVSGEAIVSTLIASWVDDDRDEIPVVLG